MWGWLFIYLLLNICWYCYCHFVRPSSRFLWLNWQNRQRASVIMNCPSCRHCHLCHHHLRQCCYMWIALISTHLIIEVLYFAHTWIYVLQYWLAKIHVDLYFWNDSQFGYFLYVPLLTTWFAGGLQIWHSNASILGLHTEGIILM